VDKSIYGWNYRLPVHFGCVWAECTVRALKSPGYSIPLQVAVRSLLENNPNSFLSVSNQGGQGHVSSYCRYKGYSSKIPAYFLAFEAGSLENARYAQALPTHSFELSFVDRLNVQFMLLMTESICHFLMLAPPFVIHSPALLFFVYSLHKPTKGPLNYP
jgi:hypothetical protein